MVALISAFALALVGEAERAVRLAPEVDGIPQGDLLADGVTPVEAFAALYRTPTCREGMECMSLDARLALELTPEASPFRSNALLLSGVANLLAGDDSAADADFARRGGGREPPGCCGGRARSVGRAVDPRNRTGRLGVGRDARPPGTF